MDKLHQKYMQHLFFYYYMQNICKEKYFFLQNQTVTDEILIIETAVWQRILHFRVDIVCLHTFIFIFLTKIFIFHT